jgi:hypothetical protein
VGPARLVGAVTDGGVLIGHRSAQASHLGNIAYVQKRRLNFDPVREEIQPG